MCCPFSDLEGNSQWLTQVLCKSFRGSGAWSQGFCVLARYLKPPFFTHQWICIVTFRKGWVMCNALWPFSISWVLLVLTNHQEEFAISLAFERSCSSVWDTLALTLGVVCRHPTTICVFAAHLPKEIVVAGFRTTVCDVFKSTFYTFPAYGLAGKILHKLCDKKTIKWKNLPPAKIWKSGWRSVDSTPMFKFSNSYLREHLSTLALNAWAIALPRGGGVGKIFICFAGSGPWPGVGGYLILLKTGPFL